MSFQALLHQDGKWLAFDDAHVRQLDARPRIDRASVVISDFDGAVSQVSALEGSPAHAVALIQKRLRADGLIDNESKILIHQTRTVGNGYQALFSAVPLDRWQQMFAWAEAQPDHCLLVPTAALLWRMAKTGHGVILHAGRQVVFLASRRGRMVYASALGFSDAPEDLKLTVAALGERVGRELEEDGADALDALEVEWLGVLTPYPADEVRAAQPLEPTQARGPGHGDWPRDVHASTPVLGETMPASPGENGDLSYEGQVELPERAEEAAVGSRPETDVVPHMPDGRAAPAWLDEALAEIFAARSGTSVRLGPHRDVQDEQGLRYRSGVAHLAQHVTAMIAVNPPASRLRYVAERLLPWASAASLVMAVALGGLGGRWTLLAHQAGEQAGGLRAQAEQIDGQIAALQPRQELPEQYEPLLRFVERAGKLQAALDPHAALASVRQAAGNDVRILRLRLEDGGEGVLRVDGMVNTNTVAATQGMQVARFVERLRAAGYVPVALDPQSGSGRAQAPGGSFSYQLMRVPPPAPAEAS